MNKKLTLEDNLKKQKNILREIEYLCNIKHYYVDSYPPQKKCDQRNLKRLKNTFKNYSRLQVVVEKQSVELLRNFFPYFKFRKRHRS